LATFTQDIFEIPEIGALLEAESVTEERLLELVEVHELEEALLDDLRSRLVEADVTIIKGEDDEANQIDKRALSDHAISAELPSDLTRHFINRASRHKILTREQEVTLAKRIERGDEVAKRQLIENNMKLVIKLAGKYRDQGLEFGDLIQEGVIGLNQSGLEVVDQHVFELMCLGELEQALLGNRLCFKQQGDLGDLKDVVCKCCH